METLLYTPKVHNITIVQTTGRPLFDGKDLNAVLPKLEYAFSIGGTVEEACCLAMISTSAYYRFLKKQPEFRERFEGLRQIPIINARKAIFDEISRDNWRLSWKYLEAKRPQEFSTQWVLRKENDQLRARISELEKVIEQLQEK